MRWFTSDQHFGHRNIIEYCNRPWQNVNEMNQGIIDNWNKLISVNDTVFVVGDVFLCNPEQAKEIIAQLNGKKILIRGNHDRSIETMKGVGFSEVHSKLLIHLQDGRRALLAHKPISWYQFRGGADLLIHGHHHHGNIVNGFRVNACVDLWNFHPFSEEQLCALPLSEPQENEDAI
jgi:calcineurin-like phosphoesterase family protein